jgi:hypothetical protein
MQRRLALVTALMMLVAGVGTSDAHSLFYDLLHPTTATHHKTSNKGERGHPGEVVWSGLVMADNAEKPQPVPSELTKIEPTLKELFGYNQFEVIGQSRKTLINGQEDWLASSKHFALKVDAQGPSEGGYLVNLKLLQRDNPDPASDQLVLETATKLSKSSPLVIKGPQIGSGQLLLVLVVQ